MYSFRARAALYTLAFLVLLAPALAAEFDASLYDAETITARVTAEGAISLVGSGRAEDLQVVVYYTPDDATDIRGTPTPTTQNPLTFSWRTANAGTYRFSYETDFQSVAARAYITSPVQYPFAVPPKLARFLQPQEITDTNQAIKDLSAEIVGGETDAARVITKLAVWVHENIEYDLASIAAEASQSASWTLENRYGVCDELTSLFISLSREAGIPARFVSGLAYTNLEEFPSNWWAHGWAEVWLPNYGWLPVDVTYGQVLWTDATHMAFRRTLDAKTDSVAYSVRSSGLNLNPAPFTTDVAVMSKRGDVTEPLTTTLSALHRTVGARSGNAITATIRNDAPYAIVTDVRLGTTREITLLEPQKQFIFLPPRSTRDVTWRVQFPELERGYDYTFPFTAVVSRGGNATTNVAANVRERTYPVPEAAVIAAGLPVRCEQPPRLYVGETASVTCTAPEGTICIEAKDCTPSGNVLAFTATEAGAFPRRVTVQSGSESGATVVTFIVTERPKPAVSSSITELVSIHDTGVLTFTVTTEPVTDARVTVTGKHLTQEWLVPQLSDKDFALQFPAQLLAAGENTLIIAVEGKDKNGAPVTSTHDVPVFLPTTWWDRVQLFFFHLLT